MLYSIKQHLCNIYIAIYLNSELRIFDFKMPFLSVQFFRFEKSLTWNESCNHVNYSFYITSGMFHPEELNNT